MAFTPMAFNPPTGLNDPSYSPQTPNSETDIRSQMQGIPNQLRDYINNTLVPQIIASNIPITAITDLSGTDLQGIIQNVRDRLKSNTSGSSGADYVNTATISGLTGTTVQALLQALKDYTDTHKSSSDHDSRYYTKTQLQSITTGSSGADIIYASPINANSGNTVQQQLAWLLAQIATAATGAIPDGSITEVKLASALDSKINTALTNTGVITTLITTDKSSTVNAINEVKTETDTNATNITNLAGAGRTTETVKGNADALAAHSTDYMKHGLQGTTDASGTTTAYTLTPNPALSAYNIGLPIEIFFDKANTGSSTVNISGKGNITLKKQDGTTYASGELKTATPYRFVFNGTDFLADSSVGYYGTAGAGETLIGYTFGTKTGIGDGSMPNNGALNYAPTPSAQTIPAGYTTGGSVSAIPSNYKNSASGSASMSNGSFTVNGLTFQPNTVIFHATSPYTIYGMCDNSGYGAACREIGSSTIFVLTFTPTADGFTISSSPSLGNTTVSWKAYQA